MRILAIVRDSIRLILTGANDPGWILTLPEADGTKGATMEDS